MKRDDAWRHIRAMRAQPPGYAASGSRREVFSAALEQAEQLFGSAVAVGPATRPLNLFYALSQGGRAIAAAHQPEEILWRLKGHGIKAPGGLSQPFESLSVQDNSGAASSFTTIAQTLGSSSLTSPVPLVAILASLPEPGSQAWVRSDRPASLKLNYEPQSGGAFLLSTRLVLAWAEGFPRVRISSLSNDELLEWVRSHLARFPGLREAGPGERVQLRTTAEDAYAVRLEWSLAEPSGSELDRYRHYCSQVEWYRGGAYAFPGLPNDVGPLHPLVAWWAALWTLSMLARYEPAVWVHLLNVDESAAAVPLESILAAALDAVPELLLEALRAQ